MLRQIFGSNVRRHRMGRGMNKIDFCLTARISRPQLNKIERGEANATLDLVERVASALDVSPAELLEREG